MTLYTHGTDKYLTTDPEMLRQIFTSASLGMTAYQTWAQRARRERRFNIARLFEALAAVKMARAEHAFHQLGEDATTPRNVARALEGMEPEAMATGPITGTNPGAREMLERAQRALVENRDLRADEIGDLYVCPTCGNLREGQLPAACPVCGTVAEAHRAFKALDAMGTLGPHGIMATLDRDKDVVLKLTTGLDEELLARQLHGQEPSIKVLIGHLVEIDAVFRERAWLLLETDAPELSSAHPPRLADAAGYRSQPIASILEAFHASRRQTLALLRGLTSAAWHRMGHHEIYGNVNLLHQSNWFINHERQHLIEMAQLRHDLLLAEQADAVELSEVVIEDVKEGE